MKGPAIFCRKVVFIPMLAALAGWSTGCGPSTGSNGTGGRGQSGVTGGDRGGPIGGMSGAVGGLGGTGGATAGHAGATAGTAGVTEGMPAGGAGATMTGGGGGLSGAGGIGGAGSMLGAGGPTGGTSGGVDGKGGTRGVGGGPGGIGIGGVFGSGSGGSIGVGGQAGAATGLGGGAAAAGGTTGGGGAAGAGGNACAGCTFTKIAVDGRHMVYDAPRGRLYVSVGDEASTYTNTVTVVDPITGMIGPSVPVGKDPRPLALSDDSSTLWVGMSGDNTFRKLTFPNGTPTAGPSLQVPPLIVNGTTQSSTVIDLVVLPGTPNTIAAALTGVTGTRTVILDDGVARPTISSTFQPASRLAAGPAGTLFGYNNQSSGYDLSVFTIDAAGVTQVYTSQSLVGGFDSYLVYDRARLFGYFGEVVDVAVPAQPVRIGKFSYAGPIAVRDATHVLMMTPGYLLSLGGSSDGGTPPLRLLDTTTFTQAAVVRTPPNFIPATSNFFDLRYLGGDAVAFLGSDYNNANVVYVVHAPPLFAGP